MPKWNPTQYLQFAEQRSRPCRDLADRVRIESPRSIIDLGCGPGNSTAVLAERWPEAAITGLDSSAEMIAAARENGPEHQWVTGDIAAWAREATESFDVVFSNAALQWVRAHEEIFPRLFERVRPGGALAVQLPAIWDSPAHRELRALADSPVWAGKMKSARQADWHTEPIGSYYDLLAGKAARMDLWETEYVHIMNTCQDIVEWYRGTGLRPFLEALESDAERARFLEEYTDRIRQHYLPRADSKVLFPFRRIFVVAYAG